jgi:hypothetical protein
MNRVTLCLTAGILLAACSAGPSEGDIKAAMDRAAKQTNDQLPAGMRTEVISVRKVGCKEDGAGYRCDIELKVKAPIVGEQSGTRSARFVKASDGWTMSQ